MSPAASVFYVKLCSHFVIFHQCLFECMRNDGEPEVIFSYIIDCQRDAIYGDGSFRDNVCDVFLVDFDDEICGIFSRCDL